MAGGSGLSTGGGDSAPDSFLGMVALLGNPTALAVEYEKLRTAKMEAQTMIELVGPANSIKQLSDETVALRQQAIDALENAKREASVIIAQAEATALATREAASVFAAAEVKGVNERVTAAARLTAESVAAMESAQTVSDDVAQRSAACDVRARELEARIAELDAREHAISERIAHFETAQTAFREQIASLT